MAMYGAAATFVACVAGTAYLRERLNCPSHDLI